MLTPTHDALLAWTAAGDHQPHRLARLPEQLSYGMWTARRRRRLFLDMAALMSAGRLRLPKVTPGEESRCSGEQSA